MSFEKKLSILSLSLLFLGSIQVHCIADVVPFDLTRLDPTELSALGRVAKLGEFYDIRSDQFLHLPIFETSLTNASIEQTQNRETSLKYTLVNTFDEKFRLLDISAEMKMSILGGMVSLKASGSFFKDTKTSAKSAKASLIQSFSNVYEQVSLLDANLQSTINFDILSKIDATHVVVGIQWGGSVFISVEDTNEENQDVQTVHGKLAGKLNIMKVFLGSGSIGGSVNISQKDLHEINQYSFSIYGDLVPKSVPQTVLDALQFMKQSPELLLEANNGKGKPIKYILLPLAGLRKIWNVQTDITNLVNRIDASIIQNCVKLFDDMNAVSQRINDVNDAVNRYQKYLQLKNIEEIRVLKSNFDIFNTELTANLSQHLVLVRSGNESNSVLQNILREASIHHELWQKSNDQVLIRTMQEIQFIQALQKQNIQVFDRDILLTHFLWENNNKDIYILFFNYDENIMSDKALRMLKNINDKRNSSSTTDLLIAAKYDFVNNDKEIAKWNQTNKICIYRNAELVFDNYPYGNQNNGTLDPGTWSLKQVQKHMEDVEKHMKNMDKRLDSVEKNPGIPEEFIYIQLPHQPKPSEIWNGTRWREISSQYAGLFFRTIGDGAASFEQTQGSFAPSNRITYASTRNCNNENRYTGVPIQPNDISLSLKLTPNYHAKESWQNCILFRTTTESGEVRPRNTAVKIWKRLSSNTKVVN